MARAHRRRTQRTSPSTATSTPTGVAATSATSTATTSSPSASNATGTSTTNAPVVVTRPGPLRSCLARVRNKRAPATPGSPNPPERQILDQNKQLNARVRVNPTECLSRSNWRSSKTNWTSEGRRRLKAEFGPHWDVTKGELECVAGFCCDALRGTKVWINAPTHNYTKSGTITTLPHVTFQVKMPHVLRERTFHATIAKDPDTGDIIVQWLTLEHGFNLLEYFLQ